MAAPVPALALAKALILAQMSVCPPAQRAPQVEVLFVPQKTAYVTDTPVGKLTERMAKNPDATHITAKRGDWRVFGSTDGRTQAKYSVSFAVEDDLHGNVCYYVDRLHFTVHYRPQIFIAAELANHECYYKVTKLHEERHVAADLKALREYMPKIKMEILYYLRAFGGQGPFPAATADKESDKIIDEIKKGMRPFLGKLYEARRGSQREIDSVENYKYESQICPGEWPEVGE